MKSLIPFYTANALLFLSEIYKRLQNSTKETEIYKAISTLPAEIKRFVDPVNLGVIHGRLGDFDKAVEYYKRARELNGETPSTQANLAELLLVHGELQEAATLAEQLASRPEAKYLLIGRILKGACLWFLGKHEAAAAEFHWVGHYLISSGSIPADFTWDFRDSQPVLDRIELRAAQLVVQVLDKKISFDEFRTRWLEVEPTAA